MFKAYFAGGPPFKKAKSREDLPDAFIWQVLSNLVVQGGRVHLVCNDGTMKGSAERSFPGVRVYADIGVLLQSGSLPITAGQAELNLARECEKTLPKIEREARSALYPSLERLRFRAGGAVPAAVGDSLRVEQILSVGEVHIDPGSVNSVPPMSRITPCTVSEQDGRPCRAR